MRISSPPFLHACYYGTDIDDDTKLIANNHSVEEIARIINVDSLGYLAYEDVVQLAEKGGEFCTACFDGKYPVEPPKYRQKSRYNEYLPENALD